MCGIVGYTGFQDAYDIVINGLRRLEYRGYDSAGIVIDNKSEKFEVAKTKGKVEDLVNISSGLKGVSKIGMGHTRWATHGVPSDRNSHPHLSNNGKIALVHNGIIENYDIDLLINCAGFGKITDFSKLSDKEDLDTINVNFISPMLLTKKYSEKFLQKGLYKFSRGVFSIF